MKSFTISTIAFAALASAQNGQQTAKYDNIAAVPGAPEVNPIGVYMGLNYTGFDVLVQGAGPINAAGIIPQSGRQTAVNAIQDTVARGSPAIAIAPPNRSFDLQSLYFACVVNSAVSVAGVPEQCTVAFTAFRPGSPEPFQTINKQFNPTNPVLSRMMRADFPRDFFGTNRVDIAVVQSTSGSQTTALLIDNLSYFLRR